MRILYVVPFIPWEVKVRSFNLIPRLSRDHEIFLVCVSGDEPNAKQKDWIRKYCADVAFVRHSKWKGMTQCAAALPTPTPLRMAYCGSRLAQETIRRTVQRVRPDVAYVERWRALRFLPDELRLPLLCDPTDSMTLYNRRLRMTGSWWERLVGWEEYGKFRRCEGKLALRADVTVFCSSTDLASVMSQAPDARFELVPNGVDCKKYFFKEPREESADTIVFTGSFKYRPNVHAAKLFLDQVFPHIRKQRPDAKFLAVGNGARESLSAYRGHNGFGAIDFVQDLRPYLANAAVAVAPLTIGAGVSNKIAEGFAVGTAVVATPLACGDLPVKDGEHLLLAREPEEFAQSTVQLLGDAEMRRRMAVRARRFVEAYDWEIVTNKMEDIMYRLIESRERETVRVLATA